MRAVGDGCAHDRTNLLHRGREYPVQTFLRGGGAAHGELQEQRDLPVVLSDKTMAHPTLSKPISRAYSLLHSQRNVTDGTQDRLWRACRATLVCHRLGIVGRWKMGKTERHKKRWPQDHLPYLFPDKSSGRKINKLRLFSSFAPWQFKQA